MSDKSSYILIVDDDQDLRDTLAGVLVDCGFSVRTAADGIAAIVEMRRGIPDVIISDLNMPAMCGFELLSVVRRRFPTVGVIAMSAAYSGDEVPAGLAADAFYAKGGAGRSSLLKLVDSLVRDKLPSRRPSQAPIWIRPSTEHCCHARCLIICCPECLRTFLQDLGQSETKMKKAYCPHCNCEIEFAIL
jgi:CheY-like chemotaxis protein